MLDLKNLVNISLLLCCCISIGISQKVLTTDSGRKIIVKSDGSWEYIQDQDSLVNDPVLTTDLTEQVNSNKVEDKKDSAEAFLSTKIALLEILNTAENDLQNRFNQDENNEVLIDEELKLLESVEGEQDTLLIQGLKDELSLLKVNMKVRKNELKQIKKNRKKLNKLQHQKHGLEDLNEFKRMLGYDLGGELALKEEILEQEQKEDADLLVNENNEVFNSETYTFSTDESNPYDNPPNNSCKVNFEGSDQGKFKVELKQEFFFSYTHEKLKSYFKNQDFLSCEAQLSYLGGRSFLTLHIIIQSKKARESYGSIDRGSMLRIKLINEDKIYLGNVGPSTGLLEPYTGLTSYQVTYAIDKDDLKSLAGNEIDTVGIIWSSGFEDYEILWVDLLQNQAQCILELSKNNNE